MSNMWELIFQDGDKDDLNDKLLKVYYLNVFPMSDNLIPTKLMRIELSNREWPFLQLLC